jgi:hypothetical protein
MGPPWSEFVVVCDMEYSGAVELRDASGSVRTYTGARRLVGCGRLHSLTIATLLRITGEDETGLTARQPCGCTWQFVLPG